MCMFIVSKALLISSATVIVRAGGAIWLNPFATVLFSVCSFDFCCFDYSTTVSHHFGNNNNIYLKSNVQCDNVNSCWQIFHL